MTPRHAPDPRLPTVVTLAVMATMAFPAAARAQEADLLARIERLEAVVADQQRRIEAQDAILAAQAAGLGAQPADLAWRVQPSAPGDPLPPLAYADLSRLRGAGVPQAGAPQEAQPQVGPPPLPIPTRREQLSAIPEGIAVLSDPGRLSLDLSSEYTRSTANRLVFRGIEIVPGIQIGVIEANEADRDTLAATATARYGVAPRLEVETRVPFIRRNDTITTIQQRDEAVTRTIDLEGSGLGDIEAAVRYQINGGERGRPIFIAGLRAKSATGEGPFDIPRDEFGVASRLATGSGFWGVEPSISMLYPSDPAVIFGSLSYFAHLAEDVNRQEGDVLIGRVDPGDSIGLTAGFGFSLNPRFSFSLGYKHNYVLPTESELNDIVEKSDELQIGALLFGMSYLLTDRFSLNGNFEFGVTGDAPDMRFVLRAPLVF